MSMRVRARVPVSSFSTGYVSDLSAAALSQGFWSKREYAHSSRQGFLVLAAPSQGLFVILD
jgi:hypothetical protein